MPPPHPIKPSDGLSTVLTNNIRAMEKRRTREVAHASRQEQAVRAITSFIGSMTFVYLHAVLCSVWVTINAGLIPGIPRFDPSLTSMATVASCEAIFLSTFVLISQNRMAAAERKRADLDLHVSLLAEHELTQLTGMIEAIAAHFDIKPARHPEIEEIRKTVKPDNVLDGDRGATTHALMERVPRLRLLSPPQWGRHSMPCRVEGPAGVLTGLNLGERHGQRSGGRTSC
jgi:uncharacterized membrane protein